MKPERTQPIDGRPQYGVSRQYLRPTIFGKQQRDGQIHTVLKWHPIENWRPQFRAPWRYLLPTIFFQSPKSLKTIAWFPPQSPLPFMWPRAVLRTPPLIAWERLSGATAGKPIAPVSFLLTERFPLMDVARRNAARWNRVLQTAATPKGPGAKTQPADEI